MSGYVIDPVDAPDTLNVAPSDMPPAGTFYYILSANNVEIPGLERFLDYNEALYAANAYNAGLDQIDRRAWAVVQKTA